jgi:cytochrome b pre-mRNA-processing protein 3
LRGLLARFRPDPFAELARDLYAAVVAQARRPELYRDMGVPDSLDGRFDLVVLHAFLAMRRLKAAGRDGRQLSQHLFDVLMADMDASLRELGVADIGVAKRVRAMVAAFYGRVAAYDSALAGDEAALEEALRRNLYGTVNPTAADLGAMAAYVRRQDAALAKHGAGLMAGRAEFAPVAGPQAGD